jgi:hypothetical protein
MSAWDLEMYECRRGRYLLKSSGAGSGCETPRMSSLEVCSSQNMNMLSC